MGNLSGIYRVSIGNTWEYMGIYMGIYGNDCVIPSGNSCCISIETGPFIVDVPFEDGDFPKLC